MRYIKPQSLTWWASFVPLMAGVFMATVEWHGMLELVTVIDTASGGMTPAALINAGLFGIGLRGAL